MASLRALATLAVMAAALPATAQNLRPGQLPLTVSRVAATAELRRGNDIMELGLRVPVNADDRLVTGPQGRVALTLFGGGGLRLGGDSSLRLSSIDPPEAGTSGVVRLVLERGALRLDARGRAGMAPQDFRANVGQLQLRVFGGEAWAEISPSGEAVCLLSGAVEILAETGGERLDEPGSCVIFGGGGRLPVRGDGGEALARKLLRTAFSDDVNARALAAMSPEPVPVPELLPPADTAAPAGVAISAPTPVPAAPPVAAGPRWTLVLASLPDQAGADNAARRWQDQGQSPQVRRSDTPTGVRYRVTVGDYGDLPKARAALAELRSRFPEAAQAWVLPVKQ